MATFKQMTDDVVHLLGLSTRAVNDETLLAKRFLNDGVVDLLTRCRPNSQCLQMTIQANTGVSVLDPIVIALRDIIYPASSGPLYMTRMSREDVVAAQQSGDYGFAYLEPLLWISPVPSVSTQVQAYGTFKPPQMVNDADDPSTQQFGGIASGFHGAIVNYALWKCADQIQHQSSSGGDRWRLLYEGPDGLSGDIAKIKRLISKRVTLQGPGRRDLTGSLGPLSRSGSYITSG